ncbi:MAG: undecaprenyl-diphosphate phosphatase [Candidatus Woesearchaeota archaeon]
MNLIEAIILGIIQGITEWLPISSSGHLVLFQSIFKIRQPLIFDVLLHFGSLLVILFVFRKEILELIAGVLKREKKYLQLTIMLVLATIPIVLVGYFLKDYIESAFSNLSFVGFAWIFTSIILFLSKYPKIKDKKLNFLNSFFMGISQAIAILPGVSRSGITISTGLMQGIKQEEAAKFSFLMAIPPILGATLLEIKNINQIENLSYALIGVLFSMISGYLSLKFLLKIIKTNKFSYFSIYCFVLGLIVLISVYFL